MRPTVEALVTQGLGYCCLWAFFRLFRRTAMIAERLGVSPRAVRYWKSLYNSGALRCQRCPRCMRTAVLRRRP